MNRIVVRRAVETSEGDSVEVKRLFPIPGKQGCMNFDPFVLWDHFDVRPGSGFPDHPHRGFEAITYMFSGSMKHTDNLGNDSRVPAGGAQRFTAGKGIVHSEMPGAAGGNQGIQLWINLPRRLKTLEPDYQEVMPEEIPEENINGVSVRNIVGGGSPLTLHTHVEYAEIKMDKGSEWHRQIADGQRGFIYIVSGRLDINDRLTETADAAFLDKISQIRVQAKEDSHFMFCTGLPHNEPVRQWGPYVD